MVARGEHDESRCNERCRPGKETEQRSWKASRSRAMGLVGNSGHRLSDDGQSLRFLGIVSHHPRRCMSS